MFSNGNFELFKGVGGGGGDGRWDAGLGGMIIGDAMIPVFEVEPSLT